MATVNTVTTYVGPDTGILVLPASGMINDDGSLCQTFRDALLPDRKAFMVTVNSEKFPPLKCNFLPCGDTAGVAAWWYGDKLRIVEAVSVYLTGLDKEGERLVEIALATKPTEETNPLPISLLHWHNLLGMQRPIHALFLITPASRTNVMIATAAPALANSLFSILGLG